MKRFLLFPTLLLWMLSAGKDNPVKLRLEIRDQLSGEPVAGATLHISGRHFICDSRGQAIIEVNGQAEAIITATGYHTGRAVIHSGEEKLFIELIPEAGQLNDVVVSGTMRSVTRLESAIPIESYQAKFFKRNPTASIFEAIGMINGIQNQVTCNVCNTGEIRINGLDGPYTMVLLDGMPIVSSLSTVYGLSGIPNSMVKRIEVVKGPASTLYGSEAVAGLINIITVDPLSAHKVSADISGTTQGEWNADLSTRFNTGKATGLLGINYFHYANPIDRNQDNFTDITLQKRISIFNKWTWDRPNNLPASIAIRLLAENRWGGELQWTTGDKGSNEIYGESIDTRRAELIAQYGLSKNLVAEGSYNYHFQDSYYGANWYRGMQHTTFGQLRWSEQRGNTHWLAGLPVRIIHYDDNTPGTEKENGVNAPSLQTMIGAFVQNEHYFSKQFSVLSGLRYEHTNMQGGVLAPRLAAKWHPSEHHTLRLSGGNGFRIVNLFTEDHAALSGFREVAIENDLKPERSWNVNLNYAAHAHAGNGVVNLDISGFYTWFINRIVPDYDTDPQKIIYDNLDGKAISRGISANVDWVQQKGFRAGIGATFMDVFVQEADDNGLIQKRPQVYAPRWSGTYFVSYSLKKLRTTFDLTGNFNGPMRLPVFPNDFRNPYSPWYTLLNLQATYRFCKQVEAYISAKNILNFRPQNPIMHPDDPFDRPGGKYWMADGTPNPLTNPNGFSFDPSYHYAPMQGMRAMLGFRVFFD